MYLFIYIALTSFSPFGYVAKLINREPDRRPTTWPLYIRLIYPVYAFTTRLRTDRPSKVYTLCKHHRLVLSLLQFLCMCVLRWQQTRRGWRCIATTLLGNEILWPLCFITDTLDAMGCTAVAKQLQLFRRCACLSHLTPPSSRPSSLGYFSFFFMLLCCNWIPDGNVWLYIVLSI
jgi:hypothetical protein